MQLSEFSVEGGPQPAAFRRPRSERDASSPDFHPMRFALLLAALAIPAAAGAQQAANGSPAPMATAGPAPILRTVAVRAQQAPVLDGRDDDAVWRTAKVIDGFRVYDPVEDGDPKLRTEARAAYDAHNFYVFVRAFDPHPDSIVAMLSRRDERTPSDQIKIVIDSYHDRRTGYEFAVNPVGVKRDYYVSNDTDEDGSWDAVWYVATAIDSLGWTAEFRIPLSQLRFANLAEHTFGFGVYRDIARYNERISWPVLRVSRPGFASQLGEVGGIVDLATPRRLEIMPYTVAKSFSRGEVREDGSIDYGQRQEISAGADIKYGVMSNLTLDATINPDFGQVEADPAVLNLSAFETFFQERRPFFLEGTGIYRFDTSCNDGQCSGLFYSRRIGRSPQLHDGDPSTPNATTILGAAKLTGRLGRGLSVGVLDALTQRERGAEDQTVEPQTNYFVARAQQDLRNGQSGFGLILTSVNRSLDDISSSLRRSAMTGGFDWRHRFLANNYQVSGYLAASRITGSEEAIALAQRCCVHNFQRPDDEVEYDPTRTSLSGTAGSFNFSKVGGGNTRFETWYSRTSPGYDINDIGFMGGDDSQAAGFWLGIRFDRPKYFYRRANINFNHWNNWTTEGLRTSFGGNFNAHAELMNAVWVHGGINANNYGLKVYSDRMARGGPAVRRPPSWNTWFGIDGDMRKAVAPNFWFGTFSAAEEGSKGWWVDPGVRFTVSDRLQMHFTAGYSKDITGAQFYGIEGEPGAEGTHYLFARLEQRVTSAAARINFTATPSLSLQLYARPFIATGDYTNLMELDQPRSGEFTERFRPFGTSDPSEFTFSSYQSNAVVRWEYRPGSALFLVWQQGRQLYDDQTRDAGNFNLPRDSYRLFEQHPDNVLLVKASFWFNM